MVKFNVGDRVRVIAWVVPGVSSFREGHLLCGQHGFVEKIRASGGGSDGSYQVRMDDSNPISQVWWFRSCDLVAEDSDCTCDAVARRESVGCLVHDRPDVDITADVAASLQAMAASMEHDLEASPE